MRIAFKEWAVVVDALGHGDQILILRKGGISEGRGGFKPEHSRFLLFPTLFHQQRESVIESAQKRYELISADFPPKNLLRIEYWAEVVQALQLNSLPAAHGLQGQHIWREEVIVERFDWGRDKNIFALVIRVYALPHRVELPMLEAYAGCKSWIELAQDVSTEGSQPVLSDKQFGTRFQALQTSLLARGVATS
jgi:hypothetical protein